MFKNFVSLNPDWYESMRSTNIALLYFIQSFFCNRKKEGQSMQMGMVILKQARMSFWMLCQL